MTNSLDAAAVYERYIALNRLAVKSLGGEMGGRLMLYGKLDEHGAACALAANIAGATALGISPDTDSLKMAIRNGVCDFMVNNLDEALRILKNEIRKKQPVSVCLGQRFAETIRAIVARGVQPDILALTVQELEGSVVETDLLLERGSVKLPACPADVAPERGGVRWAVEDFPALWLPLVDSVAGEVLKDDLRCRWLRLAPRYLGRRAHATRYVEMTEQEIASFVCALRKMLEEGKIKTAISVHFGGREERLVALM